MKINTKIVISRLFEALQLLDSTLNIISKKPWMCQSNPIMLCEKDRRNRAKNKDKTVSAL